MNKLSKVEAVYLTAAAVGGPGLGTHCGKCRDFIVLTGECMITTDPKVSPSHGICTQYIHGAPHAYGVPARLISKATVGYEEGMSVPTYCGRCKYYGGNQYAGLCAKVEGDVEYGGCCNLYEDA